MLNRPKLVALDLDGTLLDANSQLPEARLRRCSGSNPKAFIRPSSPGDFLDHQMGLGTPRTGNPGGVLQWRVVGIPGKPAGHESPRTTKCARSSPPWPHSPAASAYPGVERWIIHQFTPRTEHFGRSMG